MWHITSTRTSLCKRMPSGNAGKKSLVWCVQRASARAGARQSTLAVLPVVHNHLMHRDVIFGDTLHLTGVERQRAHKSECSLKSCNVPLAKQRCGSKSAEDGADGLSLRFERPERKIVSKKRTFNVETKFVSETLRTIELLRHTHRELKCAQDQPWSSPASRHCA